MPADPIEAILAAPAAMEGDGAGDSPFFSAIKSRVGAVCGTGVDQLRLRAESVTSTRMVETWQYRISLEKTRVTVPGGMPAGVAPVRQAEFERKVDDLYAQCQRGIAPMARAWLEKTAPRYGTSLQGTDLVAAPVQYGYTHACSGCTGDGTLPCAKCRLTGDEACATCGSTGKRPCGTCRGNQRVPCTACFGSGGEQVYGYRTEVNHVSDETYQVPTSKFVSCYLCLGNGTGRCYACSDGSCSCVSCAGSGLVRCRECNGNKRTRCPACEQHGVVTVTGSVACSVEATIARHLDPQGDLLPVVKRMDENGTLAPLLQYALAASSLDGDMVSTRHEAPLAVTVAQVVFASSDDPRTFTVRAFGPERTLVDFDGLLEAALLGDLAALERASTYHVYFSRKKQRALAAALAVVMRLDVHQAGIAFDGNGPAGAYRSADPAFRDQATRVLHAAIARMASVYQCLGLIAGVGAGLTLFAGTVLAGHRFILTGAAYGAGAAVATWLGFDLFRRYRLRRMLGAGAWQRAWAQHAVRLHLRARPLWLLLLTGVAFTGLARVLPNHDIRQEALHVLTALKATLPTLGDAQLDALAAPPATTFIENQAALIAQLAALERTADAGNPKALALLARAHLYGIGMPVDLAQADQLIARAERIDSQAATVARVFYNMEKTQPKRVRMQALAAMEALAAAGNSDANLFLGLLFSSRQEPVFARNPQAAKRYLQAAAAKGSALAAEQLASTFPQKRTQSRR